MHSYFKSLCCRNVHLPTLFLADNKAWSSRIKSKFLFSKKLYSDLCGESDINVTYFVSGYIGRSIVRRRKCSACSAMLVATSDPAVNITQYIPADHRALFEIADCGGLSIPTALCFVITAIAVQCYSVIISDKFIKRKLLSHINSRTLFVASVLDYVYLIYLIHQIHCAALFTKNVQKITKTLK